MGSLLRRVRKRKKCLGKVDVMGHEEYQGMELNAKVELIRSLIPLGLMHVQLVLEEEVEALAGPRYMHGDGASGMRYGSNPGTVRLDGQKVPIRVPRVRSERGEIPLRSYQGLHGSGEVNDELLRRVFYGISCRNYEAAARAIPGAIGLSHSTVSRAFVEASAAKLKEFQERDLTGERYVVLFLDGKSFADTLMVIAMGVTAQGRKRFLGFVESDTENGAVLTPFLRSLLERGLDISEGILVVLDGGKGLRSAVKQGLRIEGRPGAMVQRCMWHKRENVVRYLPKGEQARWRKRLQRAWDRPTYREARAALRAIHRELEERNQSAAASLAEGLEETLTLHRLGIYALLGKSFKTTNCLESTNAMVEERCAKVDAWKNSNHKGRWLATSLLDIEPRLRRVRGYRHLSKLAAAVRRALKIKAPATHTKKAA